MAVGVDRLVPAVMMSTVIVTSHMPFVALSTLSVSELLGPQRYV